MGSVRLMIYAIWGNYEKFQNDGTPNHPSHGWPWLSIETYTMVLRNKEWKHIKKPYLPFWETITWHPSVKKDIFYRLVMLVDDSWLITSHLPSSSVKITFEAMAIESSWVFALKMVDLSRSLCKRLPDYQRVNLHSPMVFLWFSMVFLWPCSKVTFTRW